MKHFNDDKFVIPWCFDRWKEWIKMRKQFKYYLNFLNKRCSFKHSDLSWAFNKWKTYEEKKKKNLF